MGTVRATEHRSRHVARKDPRQVKTSHQPVVSLGSVLATEQFKRRQTSKRAENESLKLIEPRNPEIGRADALNRVECSTWYIAKARYIKPPRGQRAWPAWQWHGAATQETLHLSLDRGVWPSSDTKQGSQMGNARSRITA
ncbi:MAG: hypothetical protein M0T74_00485 [Desulfitobacterium hafniense]|nr:hypothetical protein [Desulfitobacterium hafniense]